LAAHASGYLDIDDPLEGPLLLDINLNQATIGNEDNQLEVKALGGRGSLRSDLLLFDEINGSVLDGHVNADFELRLADQPVPQGTRRPRTTEEETPEDTSPKPAASGQAGPSTPVPVLGRRSLSYVAGLQLQNVSLQAMTSKRPSGRQLIGLLDLDVESLGVLTRLPQSLRGDGQLQIRKGRLTSVALVNGLSSAMRVVTRQPRNNDRMNMMFDLTPTGLEITRFNLVTSMMAVRGGGVVGFDDSLNLILNGGPLERLQESLGQLGRAFGQLTDRLVRYHVTGTTQSPSVHIRPFGLFTGDPMAEAKADRDAQRAERRRKKEEARQAAESSKGSTAPAPASETTGKDAPASPPATGDPSS
ncbi:MAG: hypothetical protein VX641_01040, partial [Planctomycetota bacterium]|nr:hypothetical protein [Planctomycetota bacterium]